MISGRDWLEPSLGVIEAYKVKNAIFLWENQPNSFDCNDYCYVTNLFNSFVDIDLEPEELKFIEFERYGGSGMANNAGGVRVANLKGKQLKGIGTTPVKGAHNDFDHSNGRYPLCDALREAINTVIAQSILPHGAVKYEAIIYLGRSFSRFYPEHGKVPISIGVREQCFRLGHLIQSYGYKFDENLFGSDYRLSKEDKRISETIKAFLANFRSKLELSTFFLDLSKKLAEQMSRARYFSLSHGAMAHSNISLDGRWLDLTNLSIVPTGTNYALTRYLTSYKYEKDIVPEFIKELIYTINKYSGINLNSDFMLNSYFSGFMYSSNIDILKSLGFINIEGKIRSAPFETKFIIDEFESCLSNELSFEKISHDFKLTLTDWDRKVLKSYKEIIKSDYIDDGCSLSRNINSIANYLSELGKYDCKIKAVKTALIKFLRRILVRPHLIIGAIDRITYTTATENTESSGSLVDKYIELCNYAYDKSDTATNVYLLKNDTVHIYYNTVYNKIEIITQVQGNEHHVSGIADIVNLLKTDTTDVIILCEDRKSSVIEILEAIKCCY